MSIIPNFVAFVTFVAKVIFSSLFAASPRGVLPSEYSVRFLGDYRANNFSFSAGRRI
jgi:hypothetical protein